MQAEYLEIFEQLVTAAVNQQGLCLPAPLQQYTTAVMAEYVDKAPVTQDKTFAELYLTAATALDCKTVGDCALLVYGAWPTYRQHRGINPEYYREIGTSAYSRIDREPFTAMTKHFAQAAVLIRTVINCTPVSLVKFPD
jgi:hypothetical protein